MLNISKYSIEKAINKEDYSALKNLYKKKVSLTPIKFLFILFLFGILALFLPWTQNIRSKGYINTLNPYDRPQSIQSIIDGKILKWYVKEGDLVNVGDTILQIGESKEKYLDPELLARTQGQISAKKESAQAYSQKASNLEKQFDAVLKNKAVKLDQNNIKIQQVRIKIESDSIQLAAALIKMQNAQQQLERTQILFDKGIKSLTDLENKNFSFQEAQAKHTELSNKIDAHRNDINNLIVNQSAIENDFADKLAKIQSEKMSSLSMQYSTEANIDKLNSEYNNYKVRADNYYVKSPINGVITKAKQNGIGEFIKAGEDIITIIPQQYELAVEMYVLPRDIPLLKKDQKVRLLFDGWPSIVFSGWPESSYGTFGGKIYAIDNFISENGMYRVLVSQDEAEEAWPKELRMGGGANGLFLLKNVFLYYEIWRNLNGFPPDFYQMEKSEQTKFKAPLKKVK